MHKSGPEESSPKEELYIDAKLGFTIIRPLVWEKIKVPVSSPSYRQNLIRWNIPDKNETGTMSVNVFPMLSPSEEVTELLDKYLESQPRHSENEAKSIPHAAGDALATTIEYHERTERLFAINGHRNAYILSFSVRTEMFDEQSSLFEKIAETFREI